MADGATAVRIEFAEPFDGERLVGLLVDGLSEFELQRLVGPAACDALTDLLERDGEAPPAGAPHAGIVSLLQFDPAKDPRGMTLVAGDEALLVQRNIDLHLARAALRRWVSTFTPDGRLRIYAAALSSRPGSYARTPAASGMVAALAHHHARPSAACEALAWSPDGVEVVGRFSMGGEGTGRLRFAEVLSRHDWLVGQAHLHQVVGLAPCSNLLAVGLDDTQPARDTCSGLDWSRAGAHRRFLGEAIERYAIGDPPREDLVLCPETRLDGEFLSPRELVAYEHQQGQRLAVSPYDPEAETWWARGCRRDGTPVWVPAALTWSPFPKPRWLAAGAQTTNGAAAGGTVDDASQRAWLELVERDALLRCWWAGQPPERLEAPDDAAFLIDFLRKQADDVHLLLLPAAFGQCAVAAVGFSSAGLRIGCSAGAPALAVERACIELAMLLTDSAHHPIDAQEVRVPPDHARYWSGASAGQRASWLTEGPLVRLDSARFRSPLTGRSSCPDEAAVWVTLRSPMPDKHVVRCISPALLPLTFGYDTELRGHVRARDLPSSPGPWEPHPFA